MKINRIFLVLVVILVVISVSLVQTKVNKASSSDVRNAMEAASKGFVEALTKGDASKIAVMYAEGAVVLPPNGPKVQERRRIQEFWQGFIDSGAKLSLSTSNVEAQGDLAIEVGTWESTAPGGTRDAGKFVVVWRRHKRDWKLAVDIWNSDLPASSK